MARPTQHLARVLFRNEYCRSRLVDLTNPVEDLIKDFGRQTQ